MAGAIMIIATMARWTAFLGGGSDDDEGGGLGFVGLIVMSILAPLAAVLIQMAISRSREYQADATGSGFIGNPGALADALEKLGAYTKRLPMPAKPNTAHMFIVNPLTGGSLASLFSTHPPLGERISRLRGGRSPGAGHAAAAVGPATDARSRAEATWRSLSGKS
jgi:heat shock protein HtpX